MLLAIEAGNSNIKFGLFEMDGAAAGTLVHTWRSATNHRLTGDDLAALVDSMMRVINVSRASVTRIVISSVVPPLYRALTGMSQRYFGCRPQFLSAARQTLVPVRTRHASELGADLIAGAIGAVSKYGAPIIVVQFGTATTFAAVGANGEYLGTAIAPGVEVSVDGLIRRAAKLMSVPLVKPPAAIGVDTPSSLQSGIILGFVGQVEHLVALFRRELGVNARAIATGGLADLIAPHTSIFELRDERLVLDGLYHWAAATAKARSRA
ncbi:MAG: type III pantothenate kinase [Candidatus Eremiobacteraeota bacterium]|nr:type III pantothenate kinase [Candidatus Eremiobacteraeota bacterium]MBV8204654.1 type III pantothenate kinase [Candidatus Eremiobacteraeota bacterium]MBV8262301.1 type III pantothenate kinase [Candidatus Eremiobacteraeota bacterium]MBV8339656.1 type III pantothenate kinase [Candidatus Eremiobacteraeota bacterium]MBV8461576.1 type III pantothenate kinase [Candidatus Eremiobacteraeota bacterium]